MLARRYASTWGSRRASIRNPTISRTAIRVATVSEVSVPMVIQWVGVSARGQMSFRSFRTTRPLPPIERSVLPLDQRSQMELDLQMVQLQQAKQALLQPPDKNITQRSLRQRISS